MFSRRSILAAGAALAAAPGALAAARPGYVTAEGMGFRIDGRPYRYAGSNMWYGAYLGADAPFGARDRLARELDRLVETGVDNIRVLGSSEDSPLKNSIKPAFRNRGSDYNETLLKGLDLLLAEMGRRGMKAVIYLTNFWEWSGGMMTYLYWTNGGRYIDNGDPSHPWPAFADFNADFYKSRVAVGMYHDYVRAVVGRTNTVTGAAYRDDPAIMAWQLANEPRPGGSEKVGAPNLPTFYAWVRDTARLIKSIDPNHLVSTGSEGLQGCLSMAECVETEHQPPIDYVTTHIWPQNWGWVDPKRIAQTHANATAKVAEYIDGHLAIARRMNKPLVIEEFGYPRDDASFEPGSPTTFRDRYYGQIYAAVLQHAVRGPLAGSNFWAWNGEGRAQHAEKQFRPGDLSYLGDPPHEPQGWYGVFDVDASTRALIRDHARALKAL
ncbi:glycoside hydrolase 5 family protein [Phenylobacterium deserti]|nr:cellulase family glycosylhydrolase [Phenylobacterium deserti]